MHFPERVVRWRGNVRRDDTVEEGLKEAWVTSLKSLEAFLTPELLKDLEALAAEEGRDVEAVVDAAVRRYLWDSTFRTLRRHAQARSRVQGWVSDQSILTTVLATRRPDEFTLTKPEASLGVVAGEAGEGEAVEGAGGTATRTRDSRQPREFRERRERRDRREPREPREARETPRNFRETREPMPEMETRRFERSAPAPVGREDAGDEAREERSGRRPRRRTRGGRRDSGADVRASSSPDASETTPEPRSPSYALNPPTVDLAAMRRRAESVHRFLPPDPSERETQAEERSERPDRFESHENPESHESPAGFANRANRERVGSRASAANAEAAVAADATADREAPSDSPSESDAFRPRRSRNQRWSRPNQPSAASESDSPASPPDSPAASPQPEMPSSSPVQSFGRKPKRSSGRR